jgi:hypothetical protein
MSDLTTRLRNGVVLIRFTKKDGSETQRLCTLQSHLVTPPKGTGKPNSNPNILPVWSLDDKAWRSIDRTRVISAEEQRVPELRVV